MVIWIVFTTVESDMGVNPHRTPHRRVSAASLLTAPTTGLIMPGSRVRVPPFPPDQPLVRSFFAARRQVNQQMNRIETLAPMRLKNQVLRATAQCDGCCTWRAAAQRRTDMGGPTDDGSGIE